MSSILVSAEELRACGASVRAIECEMLSVFDQIQNRMRLMSMIWDSPAGNQCMERFESLVPAFEQYARLVENYCVFLEKTAEEYRIEEEGYK